MTDSFNEDQDILWNLIVPPISWKKWNLTIIGDRHNLEGIRHHLVLEHVAPGTVIDNAEIFTYFGDEKFSEELSHLSK